MSCTGLGGCSLRGPESFPHISGANSVSERLVEGKGPKTEAIFLISMISWGSEVLGG